MNFDVDKYLEKAFKGEIIEEIGIKLITMKIKEIFVDEPNIIILKSPITCIGDIHG